MKLAFTNKFQKQVSKIKDKRLAKEIESVDATVVQKPKSGNYPEKGL